MEILKINGVVTPPDDTAIWRYMSFARFEQMMQESRIYLARLDKFSDFNEGALTQATQRRSQEDMEKQGAGELAGIIPWFNQFLSHKYWYASCWNSDETQANLLWRSYGSPKDQDKHQFKVAIKSSVKRLTKSLDYDGLYLGEVNYLDFDKDDPFLGSDGIESGSLAFIKQREYKGENEIRLALQDTSSMEGGILADLPETDNGIAIPVDLGMLLEEVYFEAFEVDWGKLGKNGVVDIEYRNSLDQKANERGNLIKALFDSQQIKDVPIRLSTIL